MSFVERALPLPTSSISSSHSHSRSGGRVLETPPDRPVWETRQPLKGVSHEGRYPSYDTSMDQEQHNILGITMTISIRFLSQAPVVHTSDSAIHRINHYPADSVIDFRNTYPLDSNLSGG